MLWDCHPTHISADISQLYHDEATTLGGLCLAGKTKEICWCSGLSLMLLRGVRHSFYIDWNVGRQLSELLLRFREVIFPFHWLKLHPSNSSLFLPKTEKQARHLRIRLTPNIQTMYSKPDHSPGNKNMWLCVVQTIVGKELNAIDLFLSLPVSQNLMPS